MSTLQQSLTTGGASAGHKNSTIGVRYVSDAVNRDHRDLEIIYKALAVAIDEGDDGAAARLQRQFCWELARHLVAMQLLIFPGTNRSAEMGNAVAVSRRSSLSVVSPSLLLLGFPHLHTQMQWLVVDGPDWGKEDNQWADTHKIRDHVLHFVHLEPSDPKFKPALDTLVKPLRQYIRGVERRDLVAIEKALDADESERMARDWERAGKFMPADVGRAQPPFATIEALLGASYDELSRAWDKLPRS